MTHALQLAAAALQRGDPQEAARLCRWVLGVKAENFEALYLLAVITGQGGNAREASDLLARALAVNPNSADAHFNCGVALGEQQRWAEALASYERAIAIRPDFADAHFNRGVSLGDLGRFDEALSCYDHVIALEPDNAEAFNNRGTALDHLGRRAEALASYERAISLRPGYANAHNNLGKLLSDLDLRLEALACFERAIALKADYAEAHKNRGITLGDLDRHAEALDCFDHAIALKPDYADAHYDRANSLRELHRHREAVKSFERAIALSPDHASAHWNLADCHLLLGDFESGWKEFEWRWRLGQRAKSRREFPQPLWLGTPAIDGRTILLHSELGLGDTLLFCRYTREVAALGATVVLEVQPPLLELLSPLEGVFEVFPTGAPHPAFDYHCPLMSLPLAFRTGLESIPASVPYVRSDPARVEAWRARLGPTSKPRIGMVWSGSVLLKNDRRSMTLAQMLPLVGDWAEWVSLQKEAPFADVDLLASRAEIRHVGNALNDFADTAAVLELLNVVVTVDTSVANLAGAMGKPVWILLPHNPHDWRWMLDREDSPWYPTARLFRQTTPGDWAGVIQRVDDALTRQYRADR